MRKIIIASAVLMSFGCLQVAAQLNGSGYYRAQNVSSGRYVSIMHNKSQTQIITTKADLEALHTFQSWDMVSCDPSTIVYFDYAGQGSIGGNTMDKYNLCGQGTSTYEIVQHNLGVASQSKGYQFCAQESGQLFRLGDVQSTDYTDVGNLTSNGSSSNWFWNILPVSSTGDHYFGVKPTVTAGGKYYATMYADFGFTPAASASGMKVYYAEKIADGMLIIKEIAGAVPASTPLIFLCPSESPTGNRLDIAKNEVAKPTDNILSGTYFCIDNGESFHKDYVAYDPETMRVLGVCGDGRVGFVKRPKSDLMCKYTMFQPEVSAIPANTAYLKVTPGTPDELPLITAEEYAAGIDGVKVDGNFASDILTLSGVTVRKKATSTAGLRPGVYIWNKKKIVVK